MLDVRSSRSPSVLLTRSLFPELAARLDAALARHGRADSPGGERLEQWLQAGAERVRRETLGAAAYTQIEDPVTRDRFATALAAADRVFGALGIAAPEPESYAAAGVDFSALAREAAADPLLAPIPAPHGLGIAAWRAAFASLDSAPGLVFASEVERAWDALDRPQPDAGPTVPDDRRAESGPRGIAWGLRLVPAGETPPLIGLSYAHGPHPSLPEMLTLQLLRAASDQPLVDSHSFTWIAGEIAGGGLAARHVFDAGDGVIRISVRGVGSEGPHLGARPPIG